eukprot:3896227-Pleurochrysis_carterae.AAC.1
MMGENKRGVQTGQKSRMTSPSAPSKKRAARNFTSRSCSSARGDGGAPCLRLDSVRVERARVFRRQVEGCASALKVVVQIHEECESRSHRAAVRVVHVPATRRGVT